MDETEHPYVIQYLNRDGTDQQGHEYSADIARVFTEPGDFVAEMERVEGMGRWRFTSGDPDGRPEDDRLLYADVDAGMAALAEQDQRAWAAAHGVNPDRDTADAAYTDHLEREAGI